MIKERLERIGRKREWFSLNGYPKVLIAAPIYEHKYYCIQDYIKNIKEIEYPVDCYDFVLVDNSKNVEAHKLLQEFNPKIRIEYSGFRETTRASQCGSYDRIREIFLEGDYEYLFIVESDLFPHETILKDLMVNDKDIVGAVYYLGQHDNEIMTMPCVTTGRFKAFDGLVRETFARFEDLGGELLRIQGGIGIGCTLIKRKVIEAVPFRYGMVHADTFFHRDAHRKGFETWLDSRFVIPHYSCQYPEYF